MADAAAVHRAYLDAVNRHDLAGVRGMFHPDYTYRGADGVEHRGPDAGVAQVQGFLAAFPDLRLDPGPHHACGDVSVLEVTARGTHRGDLGGIPATGKSVEVVVCDVVEVRDGKIHREREYYDAMTMMQQLGAIPAPA
jgi:steroid delta-isomerase-like uncharacterized protein